MKKLIISLSLFFLSFSSFSEVRIWHDKEGIPYEAEYVRELFDKLTLKTTDGQEVRMPLEDFSEHDQKYLRVMVPPTLELSFTKRTMIKPRPLEKGNMLRVITTVLSSKVTITKDSKRPFTSGLKAELFLIGEENEQSQYKILLSKTDSSFLLPEKKGDTYEFKTKPIELRIYNSYKMRRGPVYIGYLVVLTDKHGNTVQTKTDIPWLKDQVVEKAEALRELYRRGAASQYSRFFDKKTLQKLKVPRGNRDNLTDFSL